MAAAPERTRDHETDVEADSENVLATLDEEQRAHVQMQQVREATVAPGLLKLPVKRVTTSDERGVYAIELDHPILEPKETRQFYEKPVYGWTDDYEIVRILKWYTGSENPHDLQLHRVYARYNEAEDEWRIVKPPGHTKPWPARLRSALPTRRSLRRSLPRRSNARMWSVMTAGLLTGMGIAALYASASAALVPAIIMLVAYLAATMLGMVILEP